MNKILKYLKFKISKIKTSIPAQLQNCTTAELHNCRTAKKGIALLVAIGTLILILIIAALGIYLAVKGLGITGGQKRYQVAFEACEGGLEIGLAKVDSAFSAGVDPTDYDGNIGNYTVTVVTQPLFATTVSGSAIKYARGYFSVGQGISKGGASLHYHILSQAISSGTTEERVRLEVEQRKVIGID
jgi:hypothetical protein